MLNFKDRAIELTNPSNSLLLLSAGIHVETEFHKSRLGSAPRDWHWKGLQSKGWSWAKPFRMAFTPQVTSCTLSRYLEEVFHLRFINISESLFKTLFYELQFYFTLLLEHICSSLSLSFSGHPGRWSCLFFYLRDRGSMHYNMADFSLGCSFEFTVIEGSESFILLVNLLESWISTPQEGNLIYLSSFSNSM